MRAGKNTFKSSIAKLTNLFFIFLPQLRLTFLTKVNFKDILKVNLGIFLL